MGWKGFAKKVSKTAVGAGKFAAGATLPAAAAVLAEKHGEGVGEIVARVDSIAEAVENVSNVVPALDAIDKCLDNIEKDVHRIEVNCITQAQASRLEAKLDKVLRLLEGKE